MAAARAGRKIFHCDFGRKTYPVNHARKESEAGAGAINRRRWRYPQAITNVCGNWPHAL
jgi:hypothetical protein